MAKTVDVQRLRNIIGRLQVGRSPWHGSREVLLGIEDVELLVDLIEAKIASRFDDAT